MDLIFNEGRKRRSHNDKTWTSSSFKQSISAAMGKHWKVNDFPKRVGKFTKIFSPPKKFMQRSLLYFKEIFNIKLLCQSFKLNARFHLSSSLTATLFRRKVTWTVMRTTADQNHWWHPRTLFLEPLRSLTMLTFEKIDTSGCSAG